MKESQFYIIPTPIGNLEDITLRALNILKKCDFILAEDTRTSSKLFHHYAISTPLISYHQHNEHHKTEWVLQELNAGKTIGLISDAGTPGISDPAYLLVKACIENHINFECLPGATALIPALILSGFPNHEFIFMGFLPPKKGRETKIKEIAGEKRTVILYESPHKILNTLKKLNEYLSPDRKVSISREISKLYEQTIRGTVSEVLSQIEQKPLKGEIVLVIEGE